MIGTKFIHDTYVWLVLKSYVGSTAWMCLNTSTKEQKWFYAEEIEERKITTLPQHKKVKITSTP